MDVPLLAVNPSAVSARSGMDLNGVSESEVSAQKFENELNEQSEVEEEVSSEEPVAELEISSTPEEPKDDVKAVEVAQDEIPKGDDLSRLAFFLAAGSDIQPKKSENKDGAEIAIGASNSEVLKSIFWQQQGSEAASLSQDVKTKNEGEISPVVNFEEFQKSAEIKDSEDADKSENAMGAFEALFGDSEIDSAKGLAKGLDFKNAIESEKVQPKTLKSMVDSLWIQQSVKGEVRELTSPVNLQVSESASNLQVVKSFMDDLRPMLDQIRASKTGGDMVMSLRPGELGQVRVEIQVDKNQVQVAMYAEKTQAREILQSQINELKSQLSVVGLKLQEVSVGSMSPQSSEKQREQSGNQRQPEWNAPKEKNEQADFEDSANEDRKSAA